MAMAEMAEMYAFTITPVSTWTMNQALLFPWLFIVPAELLALIVDACIWIANGGALPGPPKDQRKPLPWKDIGFIAFNRIVLLPIVAFLNMRVINASKAVVWDFDQFTFFNTVVAFVIVFSLSDLVYYIGHRIVHRYPLLYGIVHKHHHGESHPIRGWADTCNAHPLDFFYTGVSTSPMSSLWVMPAGSIHVATIAAIMYVVMFVGAFGHCRLDFTVGPFFNSRFHAGHHAMFSYNYAQNIELWDRLFGTYYTKELPKLNWSVPTEKAKKST
jgi:sterol desaturase/sphingolipid hydroxylase (fatty acid hydroxylase superfamily)